MKIAVTGGNGRLGKVLIDQLLYTSHEVISLDWSGTPAPPHQSIYKKIDLTRLDNFIEITRGCEAVIHLAAILNPENYPPGVGYLNNTMISYNVLWAASTVGIQHVCMASSINALGGARSRRGHYKYFPVDEDHPTFNDDDYALSKWVSEQQADSFARRNPNLSISSLRFHALPDEPPALQHSFDDATVGVARTLWGWTLLSEAARACLLAIQANFTGHQVFFITASRTSSSIPSLELAKYAYPEVPIRGDISGNKSFYDCSKAKRLLGWVHVDKE
jgi:nucleoside-diphosphate-sugar epimerase